MCEKPLIETSVVFEEEDHDIIGIWELAWRNFKKNKLAVLGMIIFLFMLMLVLVGPLLSPYGRDTMDLTIAKEAPSFKHWLGTDEFGRDYLTRLMYGGQVSLKVGLYSTVVSLILGVTLGGVAGYYGGIIDNLLMRLGEIVSSFPFMPFAITFSAVVGTKVSPENKMYVIMTILGILSYPGLARLIRGQLLSLREQEFMQAADALGLSDVRKIFKHLIPNTYAFIIINATLGVAGAILGESALSYLGFGIVPPTPSWGNLVVYANNSYTLKNLPWLWIPPGILILITVVSINLMGDGLRDAVDAKSND